MNRLFITGNLTKDPELTTTKKGSTICKFTIANNVSVKVDDKYENKATFFNIVAHGKLAENISKFWKKGNSILCECEITDNSYEKDGVKYYGYSFKLVNIDFFGKGKTNTEDKIFISDDIKKMNKQQNAKKEQSQLIAQVEKDNEIPF